MRYWRREDGADITIRLPLVGGLVGKAVRVQIQHTFKALLLWLKDDLQSKRG